MGKIKVGDKVRVVDNTTGHGFDVGSIVTVDQVISYLIRATDGIIKYYLRPVEYEPIAPGLIVVGEEYTSYNGHDWKCIHVDGDCAWLAPVGEKSSAYVFKTDGTNISQGGGEWDINFEPVVETVTVVGSINNGDHKFYMTVDVIDGTPDWSTAKATGA